jgi:hypothetical protein
MITMVETTQWEYRSLTLGSFWSPPKDEEVEEYLNELGAEGWEVVNAFAQHNSNQFRIVLKRPLSPDDARRIRRGWPG